MQAQVRERLRGIIESFLLCDQELSVLDIIKQFKYETGVEPAVEEVISEIAKAVERTHKGSAPKA